jgi:hypothetical protein|tara:strand:+ start:131 stop:655 length:525 start_codon:yes stop_codon:yes gene_type:complete
MSTKKQSLALVKTLIEINITIENLESLKTKKGNTQIAERIYIQLIKDIFDKNNITYEEAPSQQSKDFRNINNTGLNLEFKKTDTLTVYFNDTCPNEDIEYCILFTGNKKYKPQIIFINGEKIVNTSKPWIDEYTREINLLKNKYCRGENKKNLSGIMEVYTRPTYKANISTLLL